MQESYILGQGSLTSVEMLDIISGFTVGLLLVLLYVNLNEDSHTSMAPLPKNYLMITQVLFLP